MEATQGLIADGHFTDVAAWAEANAAFHDAHVALAGSEPLTEAYRRLGVAGLILRTYTGATDADAELAGDHRRLVEAYERSDVEAARRAVREHADAGRDEPAGGHQPPEGRRDERSPTHGPTSLREATHPVYCDRTLRLGRSGQPTSATAARSRSIDGTLEADWPSTLELAADGDRMGFEALVSVGRWRGFGGTTDFNGAGFEPFTWAAGIGAATERAASSPRRTSRRSTRSSPRSRR